MPMSRAIFKFKGSSTAGSARRLGEAAREGKEMAPSVEMKIKSYNQVMQNNPCLSAMVTASHLTSVGLSFLTCRVRRTPCHEEQCGATGRVPMQIATNRRDRGMKDALKGYPET